MASLRSFLATARRALASPHGQRPSPLTFVVGNESADLDSLCSAVVLAYIRSNAPPHPMLHIPLSNLPRADLALRTELAPVLAGSGVGPDDLLTLSDLPPGPESGPAAALSPEDTRWLLVDHNVMTGALRDRFAARVVGCIDHHDDEGQVRADTGDEPRVIRKTGSCMSLVVAHCRDAWDALAQRATDGGGDGGDAWQMDLARLALGPILTDTANMRARDKVSEADEAAVEFLLGVVRRVGGSVDTGAYWEEMTRLKADMSSLTLRDMFRKDYKVWSEGEARLGTSAATQDFEAILSAKGGRDAFLGELRGWAEEQRLDVAAVMTVSWANAEFSRELLVWGLNPAASRAVEKFTRANGEELGLKTWDEGGLEDEGTEGELRHCWRQGQVKHSRKQVAPMLRAAMRADSHI